MEAAAGLQELKARMRSTWMAGDFGRIAKYIETTAEEFVGRLPIYAGMKVLDVACGTGNTAIPAARQGADVVGVDIATNLLEQARQRAQTAGVSIPFDEGDAEELPYSDGQFDAVITMFGAMFAPRPEVVSAELARVCRSGGLIAMANWTPEGFSGKIFAVTARHVPPPPGLAPPVQWGQEEIVRQRLSSVARDLKTVKRTIDMCFPFPPSQAVQLFRDYFGPTRVAFSRLSGDAQAAYASDLEKLWNDHNQAGGDTTRIEGEYLEVTATRS